MFTKKFESLHNSPYSLEEKCGTFNLRYHPKRKRWSCNCPDFGHRRIDADDAADHETKNCKHIKARLEGSTPAQIRARTVATSGKLKKTENLVLNVFR